MILAISAKLRLTTFHQFTIKGLIMGVLNKITETLEFEVSNFPTIIENDGSVTTLAEAKAWIEEHREHLEAELLCTGAILFRGFPVVDAESYDAFFASFGYENFTYKESLSNAVRINFTDLVFTANEGPKEVAINLHNEMAQTPIYPNRISLFCESPAEQGGATVLCRSDMFYNELIKAEPELTNKSSFGYNNLVVDMLGMDDMKAMAPVIFDATHALQRPGGRADSADGRRAQAAELARSGMAMGIAGLFIEAHPNPNEAKCDGPCALALSKLEGYLSQMKAVDDLVKSFAPLDTSASDL